MLETLTVPFTSSFRLGELVPIPTLPLVLIRIFSEKIADPVPNAKDVFVYIVEAPAICPRSPVELVSSVQRMESASAEDTTWNFVFIEVVPIPTFCEVSIVIAVVVPLVWNVNDEALVWVGKATAVTEFPDVDTASAKMLRLREMDITVSPLPC